MIKSIKMASFIFCLFASKVVYANDCSDQKYLDMALATAINMCGKSLDYMWTTIDKRAKRDSSNDSKNSIGCKTLLINQDERRIPIKFAILYRLDEKNIILLDKAGIGDCRN